MEFLRIYYIFHGIESRGFSCQELCCGDSAFCKNRFGIGSMMEGDDLIRSCKNHIMFSDDGSSPDGLDPDLFLSLAFLT